MSIKQAIGRNFDVNHTGTYGIEIETETKAPYNYPKFTFWDIHQDGSLRDFGVEYVLKAPLKYGYELNSALSEFADKTSKIPFIQDSISTSLHVHVNLLPETFQTFGNFATIYSLFENLLMEYSGEYRRSNLFCLPMIDAPVVHDYLIRIFKGAASRDYSGMFVNPDNVKYAALNLGSIKKFGSIELRSHRGVSDLNSISRWIDIINSMLEYSRQKELYPPDILEFYKAKDSSYLDDIFKDNANKLHHPKEFNLIKRNLWFAGRIATCLTESQWRELDQPEEKKKFTAKDLDAVAIFMYGKHYKDLTPGYQLQVELQLEYQGTSTKKKKSFFEDYNPAAVMLGPAPQPAAPVNFGAQPDQHFQDDMIAINDAHEVNDDA